MLACVSYQSARSSVSHALTCSPLLHAAVATATLPTHWSQPLSTGALVELQRVCDHHLLKAEMVLTPRHKRGKGAKPAPIPTAALGSMYCTFGQVSGPHQQHVAGSRNMGLHVSFCLCPCTCKMHTGCHAGKHPTPCQAQICSFKAALFERLEAPCTLLLGRCCAATCAGLCAGPQALFYNKEGYAKGLEMLGRGCAIMETALGPGNAMVKAFKKKLADMRMGLLAACSPAPLQCTQSAAAAWRSNVSSAEQRSLPP